MESAVLINVEAYRLADLTTGPQRADGTVHPDALEIAPADPQAWTPIHQPVPGLYMRAELADKAGARILLRLPDAWNGKLVAAGASGLRGEHNGDLVFSDFVLQKGYAFVGQNKGMESWRPAQAPGRNVVPYYFSEQRGAPGSRTNPWLEIALLDEDNTIGEWGYRLHQAALVAMRCARQHYGRDVVHCYAVGVSNGGYQVKRAIECFPDTFSGGLDWAGPVWRADAPNLIGELPVALRHFDAYARSGFHPAGPDARAIRAAGFPPDRLFEQAGRVVSLWHLHREAFWELALYVYARKLDPTAFPPGRLPSFRELINYDHIARAEPIVATLRDVQHGCTIENDGRLRKPLVNIHGTADALITLRGHALAYQALVERAGCSANYRLYQIEHGTHVDSFKSRHPSVEIMRPYAHRAFELLERWVECNEPAPASRVVQPGRLL